LPNSISSFPEELIVSSLPPTSDRAMMLCMTTVLSNFIVGLSDLIAHGINSHQKINISLTEVRFS
jgi:hypothetical protein